MSLDISLHDGDREVMSMNWLRNPFGLCNWIKDNVGVDLWHVVNDHSYDDSNDVDRAEFLKLALEAWGGVKDLEVGYFRIVRGDSYIYTWDGESRDIRDQFMTDDTEYIFHLPGKDEYWVEMEYYNREFGGLGISQYESYRECLNKYKEWTEELLDFAKLLQDTNLRYYCDN